MKLHIDWNHPELLDNIDQIDKQEFIGKDKSGNYSGQKIFVKVPNAPEEVLDSKHVTVLDDTRYEPDKSIDTDVINAEQASIGDWEIVNPDNHTFDDIVDKIKNGKHVKALPGEYEAQSSSYTINSDIYLDMRNCTIKPTTTLDSAPLQILGETGPETNISSDISEGDSQISVNDSSLLEVGKPALISDDSTYVGSMDNGEIVMVEEIIDNTTINLHDSAVLPHSTTDNITIKSITNPIKGEWIGGTLDLRGYSDHIENFMQIFTSVDLTIKDQSTITDSNSDITQFYQIESSYRTEVVGYEGQKGTQVSAVGLALQLGTRTKFCAGRDIEIYQGSLIEYENSGNGPAIKPLLDNCLSVGNGFGLNHTVRYATVKDCKGVGKSTDTVYGFNNEGYQSRFINCQAINFDWGFSQKGVGGHIINFESVNSDTYSIVLDSQDGNHPDQATEKVFIESPNVEEQILTGGKDGEYIISNPDVGAIKGNNGDEIFINGGKTDVVNGNGADIVKVSGTNMENSFRGTINKLAVLSDVLFQGLSDSTDLIKVDSANLLRLEDVDVDDTYSSGGNFLLNTSGIGNTILKNVDASHTTANSLSNGPSKPRIMGYCVDNNGNQIKPQPKGIKLGVSLWKQGTASGTATNPGNLIDGDTSTDTTFSSSSDEAIITLDHPVSLYQFRQYGDSSMNGDGQYSIYYWDIADQAWRIITYPNVRDADSWGNWVSIPGNNVNGAVYTNKIKIGVLTLDGSGSNIIGEFEFKY